MKGSDLEAEIPPGSQLLLDTSVLIAHLNASETASPAAHHLIDRLVRAGRNPGVVSAVTVMELLVAPSRLSDPIPARQVRDFLRHTANLVVVNVDFDIAAEAAKFRALAGLASPDALIVATAQVSHADFVVTNDRRWRSKIRPHGASFGVIHLGDYAAD